MREVHHKLMVVDDRLLIVGSFNDTEPATTLNDENIVVIGDLEETDTAAEADQQQLAGFARTEINRIITDLAQPGLTAAVYAQETAEGRAVGRLLAPPAGSGRARPRPGASGAFPPGGRST